MASQALFSKYSFFVTSILVLFFLSFNGPVLTTPEMYNIDKIINKLFTSRKFDVEFRALFTPLFILCDEKLSDEAYNFTNTPWLELGQTLELFANKIRKAVFQKMLIINQPDFLDISRQMLRRFCQIYLDSNNCFTRINKLLAKNIIPIEKMKIENRYTTQMLNFMIFLIKMEKTILRSFLHIVCLKDLHPYSFLILDQRRNIFLVNESLDDYQLESFIELNNPEDSDLLDDAKLIVRMQHKLITPDCFAQGINAELYKLIGSINKITLQLEELRSPCYSQTSSSSESSSNSKDWLPNILSPTKPHKPRLLTKQINNFFSLPPICGSCMDEQ